MFKWKRKITESEAQRQLDAIKNILFPHLETRTDNKENQYQIDKSVDTNLNSILYELQDGVNDGVIHKTINNIIGRLIEARKVLDIYPELDSKTKYVIIDDGSKKEEDYRDWWPSSVE